MRPADVGGRAAWDVLVRDGALDVLRHDAAVPAGEMVGPHLRAETLVGDVPAGSAVSGRTAAWVHCGGVAHDGGLLDLTYLPGRHRPRVRDDSGKVWQAPLLRDDTVVLAGLRVTVPARTVVDLALHLTPDDALARVVALVRHCGVDLSQATRLLERRVRAVGRPRARLVLARATEVLGAVGEALP
ncbi:hypothetical protein LEP48_11905 [Isoptericola sp. NEAU-Y5]|uniref:ANTAR domain-containing protein n=1 Tax=Isoptericola luteus TaxID=2879484 RepID=A0ABS7ZG92_9MICO|nr:hypothetical protein [Isoptericola sp. NEAU-Y5]MCA5894046.1 hypothetical protein [Isoptericola sp. NEAU-Y5]